MITLPEEDVLFLEQLAEQGSTTESAIVRAALRVLYDRAAETVRARLGSDEASDA